MSRADGWLALAATPVFATMALATLATPAVPLCSPDHGPPLTGMTAMYLLMAAFHAAPWLRRIGRGTDREGRGE